MNDLRAVMGTRGPADHEGARSDSEPAGDRMDLLRSFCHAARLENFSEADRAIASSQPAASLHVGALEKELGVRLFDRRGPRVVLTSVGQVLYDLAMPVVQALDRLPDTFAEQHRGVGSNVLQIGAGHIAARYLLPEYLKRFHEQHREVRVEVKTGTGREQIRRLRTLEIDVAVVAMEAPPRDLEFLPLVTGNPILVTCNDHPLGNRESVTIKDLAGYPFVGHPRTEYIRRTSEMTLRQQGVAPDVVVEVEGWEEIKSHVAAGVGISILPDLCLSENDPLCQIPIVDFVPRRRYGAITRRDGLLPREAKRFLSLLEKG